MAQPTRNATRVDDDCVNDSTQPADFHVRPNSTSGVIWVRVMTGMAHLGIIKQLSSARERRVAVAW